MRKFFEDLKIIYQMLESEQAQLQRYFDLVKGYRSLIDPKLDEMERVVEDFLEFVGLQKSEEAMLAAVQRIVNLREDALLQVIADLDEEERIAIKERAYVWVSGFYLELFEKRLRLIEEKELLSPFYRAILRGAHEVGKVFSSWQSSWMAQIVYGVNRELFSLFNGDEEKIFELLNEKRLLDLGHEGEVGDRSYSVLRILPDGGYERVAYAEAFKEEVEAAKKRLLDLVTQLESLEDEIFGQKAEWIAYFKAIQEALLEKDPDRLIPRWADVDRAWMKITTPLQIGHPLEYYEDHYRKAVALEWDVRIADPTYPKGNRAKVMRRMFEELYERIGIEAPSIYTQTLGSLDRIQLYVGRPFSFYGSEFNGLFSAQVVPNDEVVSREEGKKIFAYPDLILQMQRAKPKMRLTTKIFGKETARRFYDLLGKKERWHAIYDVTTIGHEYGHVLWMDESSEAVMNRSGMFKLAEEFKATAGGLVAHFMFESDELWEELLLDHIQRSVSLIGWMEVPEVLPYYVEGLLHLYGLFQSGLVQFDGKLHLALTKQNYQNLKSWYQEIYTDLARMYLLKRDSKEFLERFLSKEKVFLPKERDIREFVIYYYNLYKQIGRDVEKE
ncbi:MAG: invasion protein [Epsilonproteobacteria bacterium]|nr:invasion protein [Campylobacterota bacterium]NPA63765.1 invasion protein CiaB [Campylobacterota bacterium]